MTGTRALMRGLGVIGFCLLNINGIQYLMNHPGDNHTDWLLTLVQIGCLFGFSVLGYAILITIVLDYLRGSDGKSDSN